MRSGRSSPRADDSPGEDAEGERFVNAVFFERLFLRGWGLKRPARVSPLSPSLTHAPASRRVAGRAIERLSRRQAAFGSLDLQFQGRALQSRLLGCEINVAGLGVMLKLLE